MEPNWEELSADPSPEAIELLSENLDKVDWRIAAHNPSALPLLQANLDKVNHCIFEPDLSDEVVNLILRNRNNILLMRINFMITNHFKTPRLKEFFYYVKQVDNKLNDLNKIIRSIDNEYQLMKLNDVMHQIDNLVCDALK
jgi:hypothetical protein